MSVSNVIATCAFPGTYDIAKSVELHLSYIEEAKASGASLVVFPETGLQGYPDSSSVVVTAECLHDVQSRAECVPDGPNVAKIIDAAQRQEIYVIFGLIEAGETPGVLYNTLVLAGPSGYIGSYRKVHLWITEQIFWRPGTHWPVYETAVGKIGMLICYDKMWPESCRELTLGGADILVMGAAWPRTPGLEENELDWWVRSYELYDRVRATENARWFVSSNLVGDLGGLQFFGLSQIVDPMGTIVATSGTDNVGLVLAEIDIRGSLADAATLTSGPFLVRDRRPETYRILTGKAEVLVDG